MLTPCLGEKSLPGKAPGAGRDKMRMLRACFTSALSHDGLGMGTKGQGRCPVPWRDAL